MCGIVAIIGNENIETALNKIKHRGNSAKKIRCHENISIGFNRLAINDKTLYGLQPFEYNDFIGVFNGEIYNANELRNKFDIYTKSKCDTEVILPLFEKVGSSVVHYLDGFFSGFIFNKRTFEFFFIRDFIGKKPLFFAKSDSAIFIVSELKSVRNINYFEIIPKGVSELVENKIIIREKYDIKPISKEYLYDCLKFAVKKRIPTDEHCFGVFLSGGLDSSIIASIVAMYANNVIYYTLGKADDLKFIPSIIKKFGIENQIKYVDIPEKEELPALIEKIVYHTESYNPSIISNGLATYLLSREARKDGLNVILSGEGADELFCGYCVKECYKKRFDFIENMHFTELRRLDMSSMANTIEIRCPFLDKTVYAIAKDCSEIDLIENGDGKKILKDLFKNDLPKEIIQRKKTSFDVGSGIRKIVVEYLTQNGFNEKDVLKEIWKKFFPESLIDVPYFHSYPIFNNIIEKRSILHKHSKLYQVEQLLLKEFETEPFHNLHILYPNALLNYRGGTCSDKTLHFKKVLNDNGFCSKLHSAYMNGVKCHRLLFIEIDKQGFFIDVGSGWPSIKLFPIDENIEYSVYGNVFRTEIMEKEIRLYHKAPSHDFVLASIIPLKFESENQILTDIANRFNGNIKYPFEKSLRFSKIIKESFVFLKGNVMKIYKKNGVENKVLSDIEIETFLKREM